MGTSGRVASLAAAIAAVALVACSSADPQTGAGSADTYGAQVNGDPSGDGSGDVGDDSPLVGADDSIVAPQVTLSAGTTSMQTTADLNLRSGAGTSYAVLLVIPSGTVVTLVDTTETNGFFHVTWNGTTGWASATYLKTVDASGGTSGGTVDVNGAPSPANAIARAKAAVGFSYWWGGGAWLAGGPTSSTAGSCSGSCPSCTHHGTYGADCSGMVAKAWQFGSTALSTDSHPYATSSFASDSSGHWSTVSRGSLKAGDALVYNSGGEGHIVLWESGDGWGTSTVYECRGCSYGCVHDTRSFSSIYHGVRRAGF